MQAKNDLQTEADRLAQTCIIASLARAYPAMCIIGEEGELDAAAVTADLLVHEPADADFLRRTGAACPPAYADVREDELVVWVDPLDGTSEFAKGFVDHVTVLIGVAWRDQAIGGIIHQPFWQQPAAAEAAAATTTTTPPAPPGRTIWGLRGLGVGGFTAAQPPPPSAAAAGCGPADDLIVTTTRSHSNEMVREALEALRPREVLRVGGAGFKVLQLLEGRAHAYVFASAGCKKWDTCAPEAVLEAHGGRLTTVAGVQYRYGAKVAHLNAGGVLATAAGTDHGAVVARIPERVKLALV